MRIVLDASAALRLIMRTAEAADVLAVLDRADLVLAPSLFHSEVANALWKYVRAGQVTSELALARYQEATGLIDGWSDDAEMITEALTEAGRWDHPVYDLRYLVLARRNGCRVLTRDKRLIALMGRMGISLAAD